MNETRQKLVDLRDATLGMLFVVLTAWVADAATLDPALSVLLGSLATAAVVWGMLRVMRYRRGERE